ncbi:MAG: hypothetical protein FWB75_00350 [Oscillospiraceae bacterium]|nr:hypothetical protein [Oscillospiraceae bacterium]
MQFPAVMLYWWRGVIAPLMESGAWIFIFFGAFGVFFITSIILERVDEKNNIKGDARLDANKLTVQYSKLGRMNKLLLALLTGVILALFALSGTYVISSYTVQFSIGLFIVICLLIDCIRIMCWRVEIDGDSITVRTMFSRKAFNINDITYVEGRAPGKTNREIHLILFKRTEKLARIHTGVSGYYTFVGRLTRKGIEGAALLSVNTL